MKFFLLLPFLFACASKPDDRDLDYREPEALHGADPAWIAAAQDSRGHYTQWGRFDEAARWSPERCWMPPTDHARLSASRDASTHGRKLYSLYAKDPAAYADETLEEAPIGQVLVKESFHPEQLPAGTLPKSFPFLSFEAQEELTDDHWMPYARDDAGREFKAGARGPLFLMMKFAASTPDTDQGWVYATLDTQGAVTAAGAIASCIECHEEAPRDRQFGLPPL
ncbi:MAG: hypothetical protein O2816_08900 [Planctomycetota bacterium]|nr:hypothetical protein [Planctomycetota bacterium]